MPLKKTYKDKNGYLRFKDSDKLVHRWIAYNKIYKSNHKKYFLKFGKYVVHHKDGDKFNNDPSNLQILRRKKHEKKHQHTHKTKGSWFWLIFWIIVFFPIAIVYYLIREW